MTGQEKGFKQPLVCWVTHHKDLKQSVGLFFLGCPFSKASFMPLSTATVHRTTKPWRGGQVDTPIGNHTRHYSSLKIRNPYARYSV